MHIRITPGTLLREIQQAFSNYFPFLKIEFYRTPHRKYKASPEADTLDLSIRVGELNQDLVQGELEILPHYKVSDVENEFQDRFGLSIQVLQLQKSTWEQSTGQDDFTLKQLNEFGRDSSDEKILREYEQGFAEPEEKPEKLY